MQISDQLQEIDRRFVESWTAAQGHVLNGTHEGITDARRAAIERFALTGLPREKEEAWKYTNIRRLVDGWVDADLVGGRAGAPEPAKDGLPFIPGLASHRIVVLDGIVVPELGGGAPLPAGVVLTSISAAAVDHGDLISGSFGSARPDGSDAFVALNTAFTRDGVFVHVPRGVSVETPIEVLFLNTRTGKTFVQPRALFVAEAGSSVRIIESWRSLTGCETFTNAVVECLVDRDANMDHLRLVEENDAAVHLHYLQVRQMGGSVFSTGSFILGGGTVRSDAYFLPNDEYCETHLNGFYLGRGASHIDNHTLVDHAMPNCESNELYKGILDDRSTGVFNGKVLVRQDAQKTNAYQSNKSVVLTDSARMYSKPELEIYADDVKCSHGATTGQLDDDAMFYLRARGLRPGLARLLLLQAFAGDVVSTVRETAFAEYVSARLDELLHA